MEKSIEFQIKLLKKYNISNYTLENDKIIINGYLDLGSVTKVHQRFLENTTINGYLWLESVKKVHQRFLENTTINGNLYLGSLTDAYKELCRKNVKQLEVGYNQEGGYCYYDRILSKVLQVSTKKGYTIYRTPFEYIIQKGEFTAHAKTIRKGIEDVEFKIIAEKLKHEPIHADTLITVKHYRLVTGACDGGIRSWMQANNIPFKVIKNGTKEETVEETPMEAKDLLRILEESNAYGLDKFKKLVNF